ncbi:hypothetical protein ES288_D09G186300v1 [Gossypium darwinii]|uniref:Uncharacterized protein n=1 Tax=Gossypium darwinii TaxID=34276 RepID=A0A5D2BD11_GOSDA|nr:hypothetical protein ES288_D09G186300v1 [Gossypium darwinii]
MKAKLQAWQSQIKSEERMGLPFMKSKILQKAGVAVDLRRKNKRPPWGSNPRPQG